MEETKDEKRAKLLEIASGVIQKQGIKKTTLDDIAEAAGMAATSIYYYFASKNDLVRAVLSELIDRTIDEANAAVATATSPEDKLVSTWKVLFSGVSRSGFLLNLTRGLKPEVMLLADDLIKDFDRRYKVLIRQILSDGIDQGELVVDDLDLTVSVFSNGLIGLLITVAGEDQHALIEERIDKVGTLLMNGLRKR